jgi:predicted nucleic acid-binding protein
LILDTNTLMRLIDGADGNRYATVRERLERALTGGERLYVHAATMHEVVFVLSSKATGYGYTRVEAAGEVQALLDAPELTVEHDAALREAATTYGTSRGTDFHDCYLAARGRELGEDVFSLDGDFGKL